MVRQLLLLLETESWVISDAVIDTYCSSAANTPNCQVPDTMDYFSPDPTEEIIAQLTRELSPWDAALDTITGNNYALEIADCTNVDKACELVPDDDIFNSFTFQDCDLSDRGFARLLGTRRNALTDLTLIGTNVTGVGLLHLEKSSNLRNFILRLESRPREACQAIATCKMLDTLALNSSSLRFTSELDVFENLLCIERLNINAPRIGSSIAFLAGMPKLSVLQLRSTDLSDDHMQQLPCLPNVTNVHLNSPRITSRGHEYLNRLHSLVSISLIKSVIGDEGFVGLHGLTTLKAIWLRETEMSANAIETLKPLPIETLRITEVFAIDNSVVDALCSLTQLSILDIDGTTEEQRLRLERALPYCKISF